MLWPLARCLCGEESRGVRQRSPYTVGAQADASETVGADARRITEGSFLFDRYWCVAAQRQSRRAADEEESA